MVPFIKELGYSGKCDMLSAIHTNQMHQPWRTFSAIINRYIFRKSTGLDRLKEFRDQILWGLFYKKNVDFVALQWEDFMFQVDNRDISLARKENMPYPKFIKMINQDIKDYKSYKIYLAFANGKATPKKQAKTAKKSSTVKTTGAVIRDTPSVSVSKKKEPAKVNRCKGIDLLSDVALLKVAQLKKSLKKSKQDTHMIHGSGLGDGVGSQPKVPDEHQNKITSTNEETGTIPRKDDDEKEEYEEDYEEEYVHTLENYEFFDDDEEYEELYGDVNVRMKDVEHEEEGKKDVENTKVGHDNVTQEKIYDQVEDDAHVTLAQKTEDKDKDEDPPPRTKDVEPSTSSKSKESKSRSSKGTKSQPKSSDDQPNVDAPSKSDWFKKPKRPSTLYPDWNARESIDFKPPQN
nr:hypothetical protein [Tanacetum cinerariifolium]